MLTRPCRRSAVVDADGPQVGAAAPFVASLSAKADPTFGPNTVRLHSLKTGKCVLAQRVVSALPSPHCAMCVCVCVFVLSHTGWCTRCPSLHQCTLSSPTTSSSSSRRRRPSLCFTPCRSSPCTRLGATRRHPVCPRSHWAIAGWPTQPSKPRLPVTAPTAPEGTALATTTIPAFRPPPAAHETVAAVPVVAARAVPVRGVGHKPRAGASGLWPRRSRPACTVCVASASKPCRSFALSPAAVARQRMRRATCTVLLASTRPRPPQQRPPLHHRRPPRRRGVSL